MYTHTMQRSLSMGRNGIPVCFTMFSIHLLNPIIAKIKYDVKDLKYIKKSLKKLIFKIIF